jgi:hypothetical protein
MEYCIDEKMAANPGLPGLTAGIVNACKEYRMLLPEDKLHPVTLRCFARVQAKVVLMTSVTTRMWSKAALMTSPRAYPFTLPVACPLQWQEMNHLALLIVTNSGPTALLKWMIETYLVDCNLRGGDGKTLLGLAVSLGDVENTRCLLAGSGENRADPKVPSCMKGVEGETSVLHAAMFQGERKKQTLKCPATAPEYMFHPVTNKLVKRMIYLVELLLAHGASLTTVWRHPAHGPGFAEPFAQVDGLTVVQAAAKTGDLDVFLAIVEHAGTTSAPVDINQTSFATFKQRDPRGLNVAIYGHTLFSSIGLCPKTTPCRYSDMCNSGHCSALMAKEMLTRGANPHILCRNKEGTSFHSTFCTRASSDLGMHMLRRVLDWKHTVIMCINRASNNTRKLPEDTFLAIFKLAGIGEPYMACKDTPWVPTMPVRSVIKDSPWLGFYSAIDEFWARRAAVKQAIQDQPFFDMLDELHEPRF